MPRTLNKLNVSLIRSAKPKLKPYKLSDGGGLYIEIAPNGSKYWRLKYRYAGKEKRLSIGVFSTSNGGVSLAEARTERDKAKKLLAENIDPSSKKKLSRLTSSIKHESTFKSIAEEWLEKLHKHNVVHSHYERNKRRLELYVYPFIGDSPIADITPPQILFCLRKIEDKGHVETAKRVKTLCSQVLRYGVSVGKVERDITSDLRGALKTPQTTHYPALISPEEASSLLKAIDAYQGTYTTVAALKLSALLFVRPGELRSAKWKDIDLENGYWSFIASKTGTPHIVPLSRQAVAIFVELRKIHISSDFVFPSIRSSDRPMSNNTLRTALHTMDFKDRMTPHGFRAMARTMLAERLDQPDYYIEQQLAHSVKDTNGRAYNRTQFLSQRTSMMQKWADYLDELKDS